MLHTFEGHGANVNCVAFANNERTIVSGGQDGAVWRWSLETGAVLQTHEGHWGRVNSVVFVSGGAKLCSIGSDMTLRFWSADTLQACLNHRAFG